MYLHLIIETFLVLALISPYLVEEKFLSYARVYWKYIPWLLFIKTAIELLFATYNGFIVAFRCIRFELRRFWVYIRPVKLHDGLEKMKMSSQLANGSMPKFQAKVFVADQYGSYFFSGMGFRSGMNFYTAYHVIETAEKLRIVVGDKFIEVEQSIFKQVEVDMARAVFSSGDFSKLGLTSAQLNSSLLSRDMASYGQIVGTLKEQQSYGLIKSMSAFGYVTYSGSTLAGFSGAPYYMGNRVLGMHIGAHGDNMGYDSGYMAIISKSGNEDSDQYWEQESEHTSISARRGLNPDEVFVKHRGRYHLLDVSTVSKMKNIRWVDAFTVDEKETDSKNSLGAPSALACKHGAQLELEIVSSVKPLSVTETTSQHQNLQNQNCTGLQTLTLVQQDDPLKSTLDIIIAQKVRPSSQRSKNWKEAWRELRKLSLLGGLNMLDLTDPSSAHYAILTLDQPLGSVRYPHMGLQLDKRLDGMDQTLIQTASDFLKTW